jgi:hypothetical protein
MYEATLDTLETAPRLLLSVHIPHPHPGATQHCCASQKKHTRMPPTAHADSSSSIDPYTTCIACGLGSAPETMVICDSCLQGFHTGCFGMSAIPEEDSWECAGCTALKRLAVGQQIVTESGQNLYGVGIAEPHLTQGLYAATIRKLGKLQRESGGGCCRKAQIMSSVAPLPGSMRYYSNASPHKQLTSVPEASLQARSAGTSKARRQSWGSR